MDILEKHDRKKVMALALFAGEIMLKNGAETYRVEDTIKRICNSKGLNYVSAFVTPTVIMIGDDRVDGYTYMKRVKDRTINFDKISMANALSRDFVENKIDIEEAFKRLREASVAPSYEYLTRIFFCGLASAMYALLFGGTFKDFACAIVITTITTMIGIKLDELDINLFISNFVCSSFIAVVSLFAIRLHLGNNLDMIVAASIMPLLPGFALTNGIRDFIAGDLLSGVARAFESFMVAVSIAIPIGMVWSLYYALGGSL